ncbi:MAG: hypothetical protein KAJ28_01680 [Flavobacteriaceae bacterium]|nr:hypothetical protein [Flavobacteriaceae bacterium]
MKKAIILLILVLGGVTNSIAQPNLNDYKYVIVESQFHFQNEANEYDLNELTRYLFKKHGFKPILDSEVYPDELKSDFCLALTSKITAKGALKTKVTIVLKDCNKNVVFQTEGVTKEKYFSKVYNIGIRKAMEGFKGVNYNYEPNKKNIIKDESISSDKNVQDSKKAVEELTEKEENIVEQVEEIREVPFPDAVKKVKEVKSYLKAKSITNGFELINNISNKLEYIIHTASVPNVFMIKNKKGIIYKKGDQWIREYIDGDKTKIEFLDIRF